MPLRSKAQMKYLAIHHPDLLHEFADRTSESTMEELPEHVGDRKKRPRLKKRARKGTDR